MIELILDAMDIRFAVPSCGLGDALDIASVNATWAAKARAIELCALFQPSHDRRSSWSFGPRGQEARDLALCFMLAMVDDHDYSFACYPEIYPEIAGDDWAEFDVGNV